MTAQIVALADRSHRNGHANGADHEPIPPRIVATLTHLHEWDVTGCTMARIERGVVPPTTHLRWNVTIDPMLRRYSVAIAREGWPPLVLQGGYRPDETPEQAARREGVLNFLNEVLSAAYGVPA